MLAAVIFAVLLLGASWVAEGLFDFRIENFESLYPFDLATRQLVGSFLLALGCALSWWESRHHKHILHG